MTDSTDSSLKLPLVERWMRRPGIQAWLQRRLPATDQLTLSQRRIFIFISPEGSLFLLLLLALFIAGINYANNLGLGLCFLLGSLLVVTMHHTYAQLSGLQLEALGGEDVECGQLARYRLRLSATGSRAHRQVQLSLGRQHLTLQSVLSPCDVAFELLATARGALLPQRLTIASSYPLGLLRAWSYWQCQTPIWVYPAPQPVRQSSGLRYLPDQDSNQPSQQAGHDEFGELRGYIPGESLARIAWAQFARGQGLLTKQFNDPAGQDIILDYHAMPGADHETRLSQLAFWVGELAAQEQAFALILPNGQLPLVAGPEQVSRARRLLAQER